MDRTEKLAKENIGRLLISLAIPSIIAQVVNILYNMVDRVFIGRMADGNLAMSAISVALPVVTFITAVTNLLGIGGAPLAAIRLGEGNREKANQIMTTSFVSLIASGLLMTVLVTAFSKPLLTMFGADSSNLQYASDYIVIYALGTVFVQLAFGMNPYINTQGYAKFGMLTVLIGAVLNIALDPLFIFTFNMGVKGAALATILAQAVSALWAMSFIFGKKSILRIEKKYLVPDLRVLGSICALGISPFIMNSTESLLQIAFNNQMAKFGGTVAVGALSIMLSLYHMINFPLQGLCNGAQPIISFNYGAGNMDRVKKTFRLLFVCCISVSVLGCGSIMLFSGFFASIFSVDPEMIKMVSWGIRVYLLGGTVFGAQIACQQSFVALGQAGRSLLMALYRKIFLLIPLIYILPAVIGESGFALHFAAPVAELVKDGGRVFSVLFAEAISDALAAITTTALFFSFYRKHLR